MTVPQCPQCGFWFTFSQLGFCPKCHVPTKRHPTVARRASEDWFTGEVRKVLAETRIAVVAAAIPEVVS